jgi:deoxyribonuclease IV
MYKLGLKLWSTNKNYIKEAVRLYDDKIFNYIELYIKPNSFKEYIHIWKELKIPFVIHAPHFMDGFCLSCSEKERDNKILAQEAFRFADDLKADTVIFHPGVNGKIEETARQIQLLQDKRVTIENKPYYALNNLGICNGYSSEEISFIKEKTGCSFCLDIGHAICAANAHKQDPIKYLAKFIKLDPQMFHLTDGDYKGIYDTHKHFGQGNFPLKEISQLVPKNSIITNEAYKDSKDSLEDFCEDVKYLKEMVFKL